MSQPPKKYKLWEANKDVMIPLSTLYRWEKMRSFRCGNKKNPSDVGSTSQNDHDSSSDDTGNRSQSADQQRIDVTSSSEEYYDEEVDVDGIRNDYGSQYERNDFVRLRNYECEFKSNSDDEESGGGQSDNDKSESENEAQGVSEQDTDMMDLFRRNMLHEKSYKSVDESVLDIMTLYLEQKLTKTALAEMLRIFHKMLPQKNGLPSTIYKLFKYVRNSGPECPTITHYACKNKMCSRYLGIDPSLKCDVCPGNRDNSIFHEIDISCQIIHMFEHRNLAQKLKPVGDSHGDLISDITDGSEYLRVRMENEMQKYDLTLILNTDGISLVKSKKSQCWPLMFTIAEVEEYLRESFLIVAGIWYDDENKPLMNTFLQPFCLQLVKCYDTGISWTDFKTQEIHTSRIVCPLVVADAPARALVLNTQQYNGQYGCSICEIRTKRCVRIPGVRSTRIYPFENEMAVLRSNVRMKKQAKTAVNCKVENNKGVKGPTILSCLPGLDVSTCVIPEILHCALLGVGKQFLFLWLKQKGPWNIHNFLNEIDAELLKIQPPHSFSRLPRSLSYFASFKGHEFLNWILYYSIPILKKYMGDKYFQHWLLFVQALFILLQRNIDKNSDLEKANILLRLFVRDIDVLYSDRSLTSNIHQLLHLPLCVERWGPLWATAAFVFENQNGIIANLIHGSKHQGKELINKLKIIVGVQVLKNRVHPETLGVSGNDQNDSIIGKSCKNVIFTEPERRLLISRSFVEQELLAHSRAKIRGQIFTSEAYKKTKTNSYTVQVHGLDNVVQYGTIRFFFMIDNDVHFILKLFTIDENNIIRHKDSGFRISHIIPIQERNNFLMINLKSIRSICQVVRVGNFICARPNLLRKIL